MTRPTAGCRRADPARSAPPGGVAAGPGRAATGPAALGRVVAVLAVLAAVLGPAGPAGAHAGSQPVPDAAYFRTSVRSVRPAVPDVTVRADPGGEWIELSYTGPAEVVVLGYTREPYLRVTSASAEENTLSQTTYINTTLFADALPSAGDPNTAPPRWRRIGATGTVRWHDHRIHWMGQNRPPIVAADPRAPHPVGTWTVHAVAAGTAFEISGDLRWLGKPDSANQNQPVPVWLLALLEAVVVAGVVLAVVWWRLRARRRAGAPARRGRRWNALVVDDSPEQDPKVGQAGAVGAGSAGRATGAQARRSNGLPE